MTTMRPANNPAMFSVFDGRECLGFVYARGKGGFESFDASERSLGLFPSAKEAASAIMADQPWAGT